MEAGAPAAFRLKTAAKQLKRHGRFVRHMQARVQQVVCRRERIDALLRVSEH